jgi:hypothetical protein
MNEYNQILRDRLVFKNFDEIETRKLRILIQNLPFSSHYLFEFNSYEPSKIDVSLNFKAPELIESICNLYKPEEWLIFEKSREFIADVWFEFDSINKGYSSSLFFTLKNFNHKNPERIIDFSNKIFRNVKPQQKENVEDLLSLIPSVNAISHIGLMNNRKDSPIRINIKKAENNLSELLNVLGLKVSTNEIIEICQLADTLTLTFDVNHNGIGERFGIECFFNQQNIEYEKQKVFFEKLFALGMMNEIFFKIYEDWIGVDETPDISFAFNSLKGFKSSYIWRIVNHIKIVNESGKYYAKIYLAFGHKWI